MIWHWPELGVLGNARFSILAKASLCGVLVQLVELLVLIAQLVVGDWWEAVGSHLVLWGVQLTKSII